MANPSRKKRSTRSNSASNARHSISSGPAHSKKLRHCSARSSRASHRPRSISPSSTRPARSWWARRRVPSAMGSMQRVAQSKAATRHARSKPSRPFRTH